MTRPLPIVILAGGEGSRIGGEKPLRLLGGESLIERVVRRAQGWSSKVAVAMRAPGQIGPSAVEAILDDRTIEGPLGGLAAALRWTCELDFDAVLTLPCDAPFLPDDLVERLADEIGGARVAVAASGRSLHPVCALWKVGALTLLPFYLGTGRGSLRGFAELVGQVTVDWPSASPDPFFNINDAEDLARAEALLGA